jgi:glycosidase
MKITDTSDLWWKNAVIYCLDVETFLDGNGDGVGDMRGLAQRIDYLAQLGVTCLWLMPFYPSPDRDDGYDVSDFYGVDPRELALPRLLHLAGRRASEGAEERGLPR